MDYTPIQNIPVLLSALVYCLTFLMLLIHVWKRQITDVHFERALLIINVFIASTYLIYALSCSLDLDDFEHIHSAWLIFKGDVPYHDFFQHHHPLMWYLLAPVFVVGEGLVSIIIIRFLNYLFFLGILIFVFKIALEISKSKKIAWLSVTMLLSINIFSRNAMYVRPDVLMTFFALFSFYQFVKFWNTRKQKYLIYTGILIALSFFTLQKVVFVMIPLIGVLIFLLIVRKITFRQLVIPGISALIPLFLFLGIFLLTGHFKEYIVYGWLFNFLKQKEFHFGNIFSSYNGLIIAGNFVVVFVFSCIQLIKNNKQIPVLFKIAFFTGFIAFVFTSNLSAVYIHYFIQVIPFLVIPSGYLLFLFFQKNKVPPGIQLLILYGLFAITFSVQVKKVNDKNLFSQMEEIRYVAERVNDNEKVLTSIPGILFAKNHHYMFYQNNRTGRNNMINIYDLILNDPKYKFWLTDKMINDSKFEPLKIITENKPVFVYARYNFFTDYQLTQVIKQQYRETKFEFLYERRNEIFNE